jgi:hypothetical protein
MLTWLHTVMEQADREMICSDSEGEEEFELMVLLAF